MRAVAILLLTSVAGSAPVTGSEKTLDTSPTEAAEPAAPQIEVKQTDPVRVVRVVHIGPYWTAGPKLSALRKYMLEHGLRGPMYIRHSENPASAPAKLLRTEIGFFVNGSHTPQPPYETAERPGGLVACRYVDGPCLTISPQYAAMKEWATAHGYLAVGPITEIYSLPGEPDTNGTRAELQMPVKLADPKTAEDPDLTEHLLSDGSEHQAATETPAEKSAELLPATIAVPPGEPEAPEQAPEPALPKRQDQPPARPVLPVRELAYENRFDRIAEQLLPDVAALPPDLQVWLGQVVLRIEAIAKGIERTYPDEGSPIKTLAEALARRYEDVAGDFVRDPLDQAVVRVNEQSDPNAGKKRTIVRELDTIMGRIALQSIDVQSTYDQLLGIAERVQDMVQVSSR